MLGHGSIDDLFAAGTKNIDLNEWVFCLETGRQSFRIIDTHRAPKHNFPFLLPSADQFFFGLRPRARSSEEKNQQPNKSTITRRFYSRWIPHGPLSNPPFCPCV